MTEAPRKLSEITDEEARRLLDEHVDRDHGWSCGCDRCIVLRGLIRDRSVKRGGRTND